VRGRTRGKKKGRRGRELREGVEKGGTSEKCEALGPQVSAQSRTVMYYYNGRGATYAGRDDYYVLLLSYTCYFLFSPLNLRGRSVDHHQNLPRVRG